MCISQCKDLPEASFAHGHLVDKMNLMCEPRLANSNALFTALTGRLQPTAMVLRAAMRSILVGRPCRTARLALAAMVGVLAATAVSAIDIRPNKTLPGVATMEDDGTKVLEAELAPLASDMWETQKRLEEKGYRVDRGNKSATGWWLTANTRNTSRSIKVQSDGTQLVVTVER
jgi:hypothetical protein